jgi:hypothetical protein
MNYKFRIKDFKLPVIVISERKKYPGIFGYKDYSLDQFVIYCPFCKRKHFHGINTQNFSHKIKHCDEVKSIMIDDEIISNENGYILLTQE